MLIRPARICRHLHDPVEEAPACRAIQAIAAGLGDSIYRGVCLSRRASASSVACAFIC
jgi:hypothetical protein